MRFAPIERRVLELERRTKTWGSFGTFPGALTPHTFFSQSGRCRAHLKQKLLFPIFARCVFRISVFPGCPSYISAFFSGLQLCLSGWFAEGPPGRWPPPQRRASLFPFFLLSCFLFLSSLIVPWLLLLTTPLDGADQRSTLRRAGANAGLHTPSLSPPKARGRKNAPSLSQKAGL